MRLLALLLTLTLLSCANDMNVKNFETGTPKFVLEDYFDGKTKAWGMFHDRFGNLKRSFNLAILPSSFITSQITELGFKLDNFEISTEASV